MLSFLTKEKFLRPATICVSLIAVIFWLTTSSQPLIDQHEFRQTQTAITSLYLDPSLKGLLNYETPVVGSPWSIPFEFPLYQLFVHTLSKISPLSLDSSGRLTSSFFGLLCVAPAYGLMRLFQINKVGRYWFLILYFSSPIYLYWNRTFMIESTALFFCLSSLYYYSKIRLDILNGNRTNINIVRWLLFFLALTLGLLAKVTTAAPVFVVISVDVCLNILLDFNLIKRVPGISNFPRMPMTNLLVVAFTLISSFILMKSWLIHADFLKGLNLVGQSLTSDALKSWNFGSLSQRLSGYLWLEVLVKRSLSPIGFIPIICLFVLRFTLPRPNSTFLSKNCIFIAVSMFLWISPLLAFTNLHVAHNYYQCSNQIFLLMAIAASFSSVIEIESRPLIKKLIPLLLILIFMGQLISPTTKGYFLTSLKSESDKIKVGQFVQNNTSKEHAIFVIGDSWSSAFSYHSQRRSLTLPDLDRPSNLHLWKKAYVNYQDALNRSSEWLGEYKLGAIIEKRHDPTNLSSHPACQFIKEKEFGDWKVSICSSSI